MRDYILGDLGKAEARADHAGPRVLCDVVPLQEAGRVRHYQAVVVPVNLIHQNLAETRLKKENALRTRFPDTISYYYRVARVYTPKSYVRLEIRINIILLDVR